MEPEGNDAGSFRSRGVDGADSEIELVFLGHYLPLMRGGEGVLCCHLAAVAAAAATPSPSPVPCPRGILRMSPGCFASRYANEAEAMAIGPARR